MSCCDLSDLLSKREEQKSQRSVSHPLVIARHASFKIAIHGYNPDATNFQNYSVPGEIEFVTGIIVETLDGKVDLTKVTQAIRNVANKTAFSYYLDDTCLVDISSAIQSDQYLNQLELRSIPEGIVTRQGDYLPDSICNEWELHVTHPSNSSFRSLIEKLIQSNQKTITSNKSEISVFYCRQLQKMKRRCTKTNLLN